MRRPPSRGLASFDCPHCGAFAHQDWYDGLVQLMGAKPAVETLADFRVRQADEDGKPTSDEARRLSLGSIDPVRQAGPGAVIATGRANRVYMTRCVSCGQSAIWGGDAIVWPSLPEAEPPSEDMPTDVRLDYIEASTILAKSPRGAAALLRLAVQKLVNAILEQDCKIDEGIQELVNRGMPKPLQQALDYLRVIGNEAVHPGQIDLRDDRATAEKLFSILNMIVAQMVSFKAQIGALYGGLPPTKLAGIEDREKRAKAKTEGAA